MIQEGNIMYSDIEHKRILQKYILYMINTGLLILLWVEYVTRLLSQ